MNFLRGLGGGSSSSFTTKSDQTLAAQNQEIGVSGLSLTTSKIFKGWLSFSNGSGGASNINLYFNADETATNYYRVVIDKIYAGAITGLNGNDAVVITVAANDKGVIYYEIMRLPNGYTAVNLSITYYVNASGEVGVYHIAFYYNQNANITAVKFKGSAANTFDVGTRFILTGLV